MSNVVHTENFFNSLSLSLHNSPSDQPTDIANYAERIAYGCLPETSHSTFLRLPLRYTWSDRRRTGCPHGKDGIRPVAGDIDPSKAKNLSEVG